MKGKLLGYMGQRGYRIWIPKTKGIEESHNVTFEEDAPHRTCWPEVVEDIAEEETNNAPRDPGPTGLIPKPTETANRDPYDMSDNGYLAQRHRQPRIKLSTWRLKNHPNLNQSGTVKEDISHPATTTGDLWVPQSFQQAMKWADLWREPMEREFQTLVVKTMLGAPHQCWLSKDP
ncbi:hypothetical protein EV368DRAFT_89729 [Lentinula lateritia]|nr:hypothetical protein EV368DRAFT_89729 [Lentinula lateritia]